MEAGVKLHSASTESSAQLRAERKAEQQMGRRGQGEMGLPRVSSDALPALTGRRCVGTVTERPHLRQAGWYRRNVFSVLVPLGEQGLFYLRRMNYVEEITRETMVIAASPPGRETRPLLSHFPISS